MEQLTFFNAPNATPNMVVPPASHKVSQTHIEDLRRDFESWCLAQKISTLRWQGPMISYMAPSDYVYPPTDLAWRAWQAALACRELNQSYKRPLITIEVGTNQQ